MDDFRTKESTVESFKKYASTHTDVPERYKVHFKLHNLPDPVLPKTETAKTASEGTYLLPSLYLCKVANEADLKKAAALFDKEHQKLELHERVEFSQNYVKIAENFNNVDYPVSIIKYAGMPDTDMANLQYLLEMRTAAANNMGLPGDGYKKIAELLDAGIRDKEDQVKLAAAIHTLDQVHGFDRRRNMCDAYDMVFNKVAEDEPKPQKLTKAEIVAKYGEGILAEIEDEDGEINYDKFDKIVKGLPDVKSV